MRRAKRLAERAEQRAKRRAEQAKRAEERAARLSERAERSRHRSSPRARDLEGSVEDYVDRIADKWTRKAEGWLGDTKDWFGDKDDYNGDMYGSYGEDEEMTGTADYDEADEARHRERNRRSEAGGSRRSSYESMSGHRSRHRRSSGLRARFRRNRGLYRDKEAGKVCGVCAGLADYFWVETWQVRLVAVLGLVFLPSLAVPVYFILYFLMDDKPYYRKVTDKYAEESEMTDDERHAGNDGQSSSGYAKRHRASPNSEMSNAQALREAKRRFADIEDRVRQMETHVTSSQFELQRELRKISGEDQ